MNKQSGLKMQILPSLCAAFVRLLCGLFSQLPSHGEKVLKVNQIGRQSFIHAKKMNVPLKQERQSLEISNGSDIRRYLYNFFNDIF